MSLIMSPFFWRATETIAHVPTKRTKKPEQRRNKLVTFAMKYPGNNNKGGPLGIGNMHNARRR